MAVVAPSNFYTKNELELFKKQRVVKNLIEINGNVYFSIKQNGSLIMN